MIQRKNLKLYQQNFFRKRYESLSPSDVLAYDLSTLSTYSENQREARYGFNKAHDGLKTIKLLTLYSIDSRQPIAFTKQAGNLPDVTSITKAIKELSAFGVKTTEIITDNGYYCEQNFSESYFRLDLITLLTAYPFFLCMTSRKHANIPITRMVLRSVL